MDDKETGPFFHGTKADLRPGDLISPGHRSNFGYGRRKSAWVYMSAILSPWGAELAVGDGPGRIYIVEPTGPWEDDPDLTDKRFPGNPRRSYRSRAPLKVVGEVTDWVGHSPAEIQAMMDARDRRLAAQAAQIARIPVDGDLAERHARADVLATRWRPDAEYLGCVFEMIVRGDEVEVLSAPLGWREEELSLSGRAAEVTAWREGWAAVLESCVTEIGLSLEARVWVAVEADQDRLRFRVDADGAERSWQRNLQLERGALSDLQYGELWDFAAGVD